MYEIRPEVEKAIGKLNKALKEKGLKPWRIIRI